MTSISFMATGGLKKCMPMTLSLLVTAEAISVMEMEEVLVARMHSGLVAASSFWKMLFFRSCLLYTSRCV